MTKKKQEETPREIPLPGEGQVICVVTGAMGAEWIKVICTDNVERIARIPGKFRKRVWISPGDLVLCAPWDFRGDRADVIYRYEKHEKKYLLDKGIVPKEFLDLVGV